MSDTSAVQAPPGSVKAKMRDRIGIGLANLMLRLFCTAEMCRLLRAAYAGGLVMFELEAKGVKIVPDDPNKPLEKSPYDEGWEAMGWKLNKPNRNQAQP